MTDSELLQGIYTASQTVAFWLPFSVGVLLSYISFSVMFRWLR